MAIDNVAMGVSAVARPYVQTAFSQSFVAEDYRSQYRQHGERVRWWKAVEMPPGTPGLKASGKKYFEQILSDDIRVMIFTDIKDTDFPDWGEIIVGDIKLSSMPDEIRLARNDRILAIDRPRDGEKVLTFTGNTATIPRLHVKSVLCVYEPDGEVDILRYEVQDRQIIWLDGTPPGSITVKYEYYPQYEFLGKGDREAFLGADALRLPQIIPLRLLGEGLENE